jgi:hypothetical protein
MDTETALRLAEDWRAEPDAPGAGLIVHLAAKVREQGAELQRLRERDEAAAAVVERWNVLRKYADRYPIILVDALDRLTETRSS